MSAETECYENKRGLGVGTLFLGIAIGALAGGLAALLLAPRSGKETQEMLKGKVAETQHKLQSRVQDVKERVGKVKENMRARAEEEVESVESKKY